MHEPNVATGFSTLRCRYTSLFYIALRQETVPSSKSKVRLATGLSRHKPPGRTVLSDAIAPPNLLSLRSQTRAVWSRAETAIAG